MHIILIHKKGKKTVEKPENRENPSWGRGGRLAAFIDLQNSALVTPSYLFLSELGVTNAELLL